MGFDLVAVERPWGEIYALLASGDYELFLARYECGSADASDLLDAVLHRPDPELGYGVANYLAYANTELDALIEASDRTLSLNRRRELLMEAVEIASEDLAMIPLWHDLALFGVRDGIEWTPRLDHKVLGVEIGRSTGASAASHQH